MYHVHCKQDTTRYYQHPPDQRVQEWVNDCLPWDEEGPHGKQDKSKLRKYRMKHSHDGELRNGPNEGGKNLAPRQQRFMKKEASRRGAEQMKRAWKGVNAKWPTDSGNTAQEPGGPKRYMPPRLQKRQTTVDNNSGDWVKNTTLKNVLAVPGNFYPEGIADLHAKYNADANCELKPNVKCDKTQNASGETFNDFMKSYVFMANFMRYQFCQWQQKKAGPGDADIFTDDRIATHGNADIQVEMPSPGAPHSSKSSGNSSPFNDIVKSTTGHDMENFDISLGAPVSPVSANSPSENSSLPSELYECCAANEKAAQSTTKKPFAAKESIMNPMMPGRNIHPNSPYHRRICNIVSPFDRPIDKRPTDDALVLKTRELAIDAPQTANNPANSSMVSNGRVAANATFNKSAGMRSRMSSGYMSGLGESKNLSGINPTHNYSVCRYGSIGAPRLSASTNDSSKATIGTSVAAGNTNFRVINENSQVHTLKKTYGEFYCRHCDRSWCSNNVWVIRGTRQVYIKRTCNQCHKVIEPWYISR